jgi:hypothetical protein
MADEAATRQDANERLLEQPLETAESTSNDLPGLPGAVSGTRCRG